MKTTETIIEGYKGTANVSLGLRNSQLKTIGISNQFADSEISLYGAHVLSFRPKGKDELLWMSENSFFEEGKAIRGGIPICFPWFGPIADNPKLPIHGFARLSNWNLEEIADLNDYSTKIVLGLTSNDFTRNIWPFEFSAKLIVVIGNSLNVSLQYKNTGKTKFTCTDALHTYFKVSDIERIQIEGLKNTSYYQGFSDAKLIQKEEHLLLANEENRRYIDTTNECTIVDKVLNREIKVAKTGSKVTVVWNPWDASANIADFTATGYKTMVCVEAANTYTDIVTLQPGEEFCISTTISCD
jgi:glucose-6-phosphate 1-epimerase